MAENFEDLHRSEEAKVNTWIDVGCGCKLGDLGPCSQTFSRDDVQGFRDEMNALTRNEKDMVLMGFLRASRPPRENLTTYTVSGKRVCRKTFLFMFGISLKYFTSLVKHFDDNGLVARIHGNVKRTSHNEMPFESKAHFKTFVENFGEENAVTLPGRIPGYRDERILLLPSHI